MELKLRIDKRIRQDLASIDSTRARMRVDFKGLSLIPQSKREECIALQASIDARELVLKQLMEVVSGY